MLAIVSSVEHFRVFAGRKFTIKTDHKPLVSILQNPRAKLSARLERLSLRLQQYDYEVEHISGKDNPADFLSRHAHDDEMMPQTKEGRATQEYVCFLSRVAVPKAITMTEVETAYAEDPLMQKLIVAIQEDDKMASDKMWEETALKAYVHIHHELTATDNNVIFRGTRLVLPDKLQRRAIEIAHRGQQGVVKTKQLIREKNWFPGLDKKVEDLIKNCRACQSTVSRDKPPPLQMTELPPGPWHTLAAAFAGPLPGEKYLLVLVD